MKDTTSTPFAQSLALEFPVPPARSAEHCERKGIVAEAMQHTWALLLNRPDGI